MSISPTCILGVELVPESMFLTAFNEFAGTEYTAETWTSSDQILMQKLGEFMKQAFEGFNNDLNSGAIVAEHPASVLLSGRSGTNPVWVLDNAHINPLTWDQEGLGVDITDSRKEALYETYISKNDTHPLYNGFFSRGENLVFAPKYMFVL